MKELDRSKPYADIRGDVHGRVFEQNGVCFNADGEEWTPADSTIDVDDAEAALRARIEADVRRKIGAEQKAKAKAEAPAKPASPQPNPITGGDPQLEAQLGGAPATPLETLGLSSKVESALRGAQVDSVEALVACTEDQLLALPNVGAKAVADVKKALKAAKKKLAA
jgi:DNA-directed RNA polymerase alpha subunit